MLGVNQLDFINYCNALKGNYRKGVHKMETLLENPTHAKEFAKNLGGVSVVLGTPVGKEDRNSETLRSMLLASDVANDAVYTWMGQYYEFDSWDELLGDEDRCKAMMANELLWRALSASGVAMGKTVATLAGLSCSAYDDMSAVAASSTAMAAVASSQTAMAAIFRSSTALQVVQNNASAWAIFSNASSTVMGKTVAELAGLNPSGYADMNAIASSSTAMAAVANNKTALTAVINNASALNTVVSSSTAMAAIVASQTARKAIESSNTAISALSASSRVVTGYATIGTAYNKDCWIVSACCTTSNSSSYQYTIGNFYDSPTTKTGMYGNTHKAVSRFAKNAAVTADTAGGWQHEIKYIPC